MVESRIINSTTLKHLLFRFLKEKNALSPFLENLYKLRNRDFDDYLKTYEFIHEQRKGFVDYGWIIGGAFDASWTQEGITYWYSLNLEFTRVLIAYENHYEKLARRKLITLIITLITMFMTILIPTLIALLVWH